MMIQSKESIQLNHHLDCLQNGLQKHVKEDAEILGYTVVDPPSVVSTHLTEIIRANAHDLLGRQETKQLIDHLRETYPILSG